MIHFGGHGTAIGDRQLPHAVGLTGGECNDVTQLEPLIEAIPDVRGRRSPTAVYGDQGCGPDKYRNRLKGSHHTSLAAARRAAGGWASSAGASSARSSGITARVGCASAGNAATTSTRHSSAWPPASSATGTPIAWYER